MTWDVLSLKQEDKVHFKVGFVLLFFILSKVVLSYLLNDFNVFPRIE